MDPTTEQQIITRKDYYKAKAMQAILSNPDLQKDFGIDANWNNENSNFAKLNYVCENIANKMITK